MNLRRAFLPVFGVLAFAAFTPSIAAAALQPVSRIVAVVNDEVISTQDIENRLDLILRTTRLPDNSEVRAKLRPQVLRGLVDERLQLQEAARVGITVSDSDLEEGILALEAQRGMPPGSLKSSLAGRGVEVSTFEQQLRSQLAWNKLISQRVRPRVRITEEEINRERSKLVQEGSGNDEVQVMLLNLPVDRPGNENQVRSLAEKLSSEIKGGAPFESVASELSGGAGRSAVVKPFWLPIAEMEPVLASQLVKAETGQVVGPVRTLQGYLLVKVVDRRSQEEEGFTTEVVIKDILLRLRNESAKEDVDLMLSIGKEVARNPGTCSEPTVAGIDGDLKDFDIDVSFRREIVENLAGQLKDIVGGLGVGEVSDPYASPQGIRLFILCEKVEKPGKLGDKNEARQRIYQEKIELEAQKYLRNLRRDASVEMRLLPQSS